MRSAQCGLAHLFLYIQAYGPILLQLVGLFVLGWSIIIHTLVGPFARVQYAHQPIKIMRHMCFFSQKVCFEATLFGPLVFTLPNPALLT